MADIRSEFQSAAPGAKVQLFELDLRPIGFNVVQRFSPTGKEGPSPDIMYGGIAYPARPIEATDFEVTGSGRAEPKISISNVTLAGSQLAAAYDDLVGALVKRVVTFAHHLDDGSDPDSDAHWPEQVYEISAKSSHTRYVVSWSLTPINDIDEQMIPARLVLRNVCPFIYRTWNPDAEDWDYTKTTCPYRDPEMYKPNGDTTTDPTQDLCGKQTRDCKLRFGNAPLPYGGFPGVRN